MKKKLSNSGWLFLVTCLAAQHLAVASAYPTAQEIPISSLSHEQPSTSNAAIEKTALITASDYSIFLNSVATSDPYDLYEEKMGSDSLAACIVRAGSPGSYTYSVIAGKETAAMPYMTELSVACYCNWIKNDLQTEEQDFINFQDGSYKALATLFDISLACSEVTFSIAMLSTASELSLDINISHQLIQITPEEEWAAVGIAGLTILGGGAYYFRDHLPSCADDFNEKYQEDGIPRYPTGCTTDQTKIIQKKSISWSEVVSLRDFRIHYLEDDISTVVTKDSEKSLSNSKHIWNKNLGSFSSSDFMTPCASQLFEEHASKERARLFKENASKKKANRVNTLETYREKLCSENKDVSDSIDGSTRTNWLNDLIAKLENDSLKLSWSSESDWLAWHNWVVLTLPTEKGYRVVCIANDAAWKDWYDYGVTHGWPSSQEKPPESQQVALEHHDDYYDAFGGSSNNEKKEQYHADWNQFLKEEGDKNLPSAYFLQQAYNAERDKDVPHIAELMDANSRLIGQFHQCQESHSDNDLNKYLNIIEILKNNKFKEALAHFSQISESVNKTSLLAQQTADEVLLDQVEAHTQWLSSKTPKKNYLTPTSSGITSDEELETPKEHNSQCSSSKPSPDRHRRKKKRGSHYNSGDETDPTSSGRSSCNDSGYESDFEDNPSIDFWRGGDKSSSLSPIKETITLDSEAPIYRFVFNDTDSNNKIATLVKQASKIFEQKKYPDIVVEKNNIIAYREAILKMEETRRSLSENQSEINQKNYRLAITLANAPNFQHAKDYIKSLLENELIGTELASSSLVDDDELSVTLLPPRIERRRSDGGNPSHDLSTPQILKSSSFSDFHSLEMR